MPSFSATIQRLGIEKYEPAAAEKTAQRAGTRAWNGYPQDLPVITPLCKKCLTPHCKHDEKFHETLREAEDRFRRDGHSWVYNPETGVVNLEEQNVGRNLEAGRVPGDIYCNSCYQERRIQPYMRYLRWAREREQRKR